MEAFDLRAVDYVLKPVRAERLAETVTRLVGERRRTRRRAARTRSRSSSAASPAWSGAPQITHVEAQGDYARLHTADGVAPAAGAADPAGGRVGRRPASYASTAPSWSPSRT